MKIKLSLAAFVAMGAMVAPLAMADDTDMDRSHPKAFVKDSMITTKIKSKLAADHITSLGRIKVDTDKDGVVWLSGTARTQEAIDKAISVAKNTKGVRDVKSTLTIKADD
jgi:hyperosmotically inducible periplasmic protein